MRDIEISREGSVEEVTMTLFRRTVVSHSPVNPWNERNSYHGKLVLHVTFGFAGPEMWPVVSCGIVAIRVKQGVSSARLHDQSSC